MSMDDFLLQILQALQSMQAREGDGEREGREPNAVQKAVLFWTFQMSARLERVGGVRDEAVESAEDYFAPITYQEYQRGNISATALG